MTVSDRNPMKDQVAIAAAATTGFAAKNMPRTQTALAAEAAMAAIRAAGLTRDDVDGLCGSWPMANVLQSALGLPRLTWSGNPYIPMVDHIATAAAAVHAGLCQVALVYHGAYRAIWNTGSALKDPFRRVGGMQLPSTPPESFVGAPGYAGWASRYMHEFGATREDFAAVALNARANAVANPAAALRKPLTMDEYLEGRMVREPLCLYDMDIAVDGGDAFIITTAERARDLPLKPVLINAAVLGQVAHNEEDQTVSLRENGQQVVVETLKAKGDFWIDDIDVYFPYDGFSVIALNWIENAGWCEPGQAGAFLRQHRHTEEGSVLINGRVPVNPHGGSLGEGATQASGHVREAVHQLQGLAGERQVADARRALITAGGFFFNAQGLLLHAG